jgi:light-regulated signal transduction histidine kinase (bacteriophytochrome)
VWALLSVSLVRDGWGAPLYFVAHATDITSLKTAQQSLAQHAKELERSNAELEHFASVASHDLQAPLRTVTSYTQLLAERYRAQVDDRADRWIGYIVGGVDKMRRMIDGLLSLARVRMDRERLLPADTAAIVEAEWERLGASTDTGGAQLSHGFLPIIAADTAQMEQLFQNLLSNAVKYRRADLPLRITVSATRQVGSARAEWEFAVTDNGVGVDMIHAKRIFEIFERVPGDIDQTGAGIGLAVCERIVARHGGRIWVESELGSGARFRFTLVEQTT